MNKFKNTTVEPLKTALVVIFLSAIVCSCSMSSVYVHNDGYYLELARKYAINNCTSFWDGSNGDYYIDRIGDLVIYVGSRKLDSFYAETRVLMGRHGNLVEIDNGGYRMFPDTYPGIKSKVCCNYRISHDNRGLEKKYVDPYADCHQ